MQHQAGTQQLQPQFTLEGGHVVMFHQEATGLPQKRDVTVNDRDRIMDLLATEKYLTHGYNVSMLEASHDQLHQVLKQNHDACHQLQRQLFNAAFKKGWYRLPVADAQSVVTTYNQADEHRSEFPFPGQQIQPSTPQMGDAGNQQLNRRVQQALQHAEQGKVSTRFLRPDGQQH